MKVEKHSETKSDCDSCDATHDAPAGDFHAASEMHPDHAASKKRISRIKGQMEAVARMIDERRYCPEIIYQIRAATNAMKALEQEILRVHLKSCVKTAFQSKDPFEMDEKVNEILKMMSTI